MNIFSLEQCKMGQFKSVEEVDLFYSMLEANVLTNQGSNSTCSEYRPNADTSNKYVQTSRRINGIKITIRVHRVALLKKIRSVQVPEGLEASHLCHNKRCINLEHIVAETHAVNQSRIECANIRMATGDSMYCTGYHEGNKKCV